MTLLDSASIERHLEALADSLNYRPRDFEYDVDMDTLKDKKTNTQWMIFDGWASLVYLLAPEGGVALRVLSMDDNSFWVRWKYRRFWGSWKYWKTVFHDSSLKSKNSKALDGVTISLNSNTFA